MIATAAPIVLARWTKSQVPPGPSPRAPSHTARARRPGSGGLGGVQQPVVVALEGLLVGGRRAELVGLEPGRAPSPQGAVAVLPVRAGQAHGARHELRVGQGHQEPDLGAEQQRLLHGHDVGPTPATADDERARPHPPAAQDLADRLGHRCLGRGREPGRRTIGLVDHVPADSDRLLQERDGPAVGHRRPPRS